jgi:hypothetical protein
MPTIKFAIVFDAASNSFHFVAFGQLHSPVLEYLPTLEEALATLEEVATSEDLVVLQVANKRASPATFGSDLVAVAVQSKL